MSEELSAGAALPITIIYENREYDFRLSYYDTVGDLKEEITERLNIPKFKQDIHCWTSDPDSDFSILGVCCNRRSNYLVLYERHEQTPQDSNVTMANSEAAPEPVTNNAEMEASAALDFIEYYSRNYDDHGILFHVCRLEDAIHEACFTTQESRKILLLYLHNKNDKFSKIFGENLSKPEVANILYEKFFLLGWDLENSTYHPALIDALNARTELCTLTHFIEKKICAVFLIVPVKESFTLFSCMKTKVKSKDFLETLVKAKEFFINEREIEEALTANSGSSNDLGSRSYQQMMLNMLGDRDYDNFDHWEFEHLETKIGFALYGPPQIQEGYDEKQKKKIKFLFNIIHKESNKISKWKDRIVISCIYNCTEPLPSEKQKRSKKYKDYNPTTDLTPIPLFILRKCKNSENPCRIIIDDSGRVYKTWRSYVTENKLHKCEMILPLNGRYQADETGKVKLEQHLSPACGLDVKILQGFDIATTAAGLASGGVFIAAAIPALTVAPIALTVAGATGIGVGLYSIGRSIYTLYDRGSHEETLSFGNSDARGAYLNIVAGSLGFVGAGANVAVSQLAARGVNIGQGATATINVLGIANIGASGASFINSGYDVFDQWWNENQTPSLLTLVQLSSSLIFFAHAVYSFQPAGTAFEEAQTKTLRDYQDSLRSNRHRKTFNKLMKETIRQNNGNARQGRAEVIKTISNIQNKDEAFASLTRLNKQMNKDNVKFSAQNGQIHLNGVAIDMSKFQTMDKREATVFFSTLSSNSEPTHVEVATMSDQLLNCFKGIEGSEIKNIAGLVLKMFANTDESVRDKIINTVAAVFSTLLSSPLLGGLQEMFPGIDMYMKLFSMVGRFFEGLIKEVEDRYQQWLKTKDPSIEEPLFINLSITWSTRFIEIFNFISNSYYVGCNPTESIVKEITKYFYTWFANEYSNYVERCERKKSREAHSKSAASKIKCLDCNGDFYERK